MNEIKEICTIMCRSVVMSSLISFDLQIKLFCCHPVKQEMLDTKFEIHKDKTLREATASAREVGSVSK